MTFIHIFVSVYAFTGLSDSFVASHDSTNKAGVSLKQQKSEKPFFFFLESHRLFPTVVYALVTPISK
jgi:hypothetical protein